MKYRLESEEMLVRHMLPGDNPDRAERAAAWDIWQMNFGESALRKFIRIKNNSLEPDEDIFQNAMLAAYQEVERGRYTPQPGVPFTAYVKGIAYNKIREARRRSRPAVALEEVEFALAGTDGRQPEAALERHEQRTHLHKGMARLTDGRRQVLERYIQGEGTTEIANALEMSEDAVRQHKSRGLRRLRQLAAVMGF